MRINLDGRNTLQSLVVLAALALASGPWAAPVEVYHETFNNVTDTSYATGTSGSVAGADAALNYLLGVDHPGINVVNDAGNKRLQQDTITSNNTDPKADFTHTLAPALNVDNFDSIILSFRVRVLGSGPDSGRGMRFSVLRASDDTEFFVASFNSETDQPTVKLIGPGGQADVGTPVDLVDNTYQITAKFTKNGAETSYELNVVNETSPGGVGTISAATGTMTGVAPAGTLLDTVRFRLNRRTNIWVDDFSVSTESGGAGVEDWREMY